jgi:hypothetical protein
MFIGEFGCVIPLLWQSQTRRRRRKALAAGYQALATDEHAEDGVAGEEVGQPALNPLTGFAVCWMWFPAFFDSESSLHRLHAHQRTV